MRCLLALILAATVLLGTAPPALATKPCSREAHRAGADVLLTGRVVAKPAPLVLIVEVQRYERGSGARYVAVDVKGWQALRSWAAERKGEYQEMALQREFGLVTNDICTGDPAGRGLDQVSEPQGGLDLRSSLLIQYLLLCAALAVILLSVFQRFRPRNSTATRVHRRGLWALILAAVLLGTAPAAASQECIPLRDREEADVLLVGRVIAKPTPLVYIVEVDRYHRGRGARYVAVDLKTWRPFGSWSAKQKGVWEVMALRREFGLTQADSCFSGPPELLAGYGEIYKPTGGLDLRSSWLIQFLLLCGALLIFLLYPFRNLTLTRFRRTGR